MPHHVHDFLNLLLDADAPVPIDSLPALVSERFGADARFVNCKERQFNLDELVEFLTGRGKIAVVGGQVRPVKSRMCKH